MVVPHCFHGYVDQMCAVVSCSSMPWLHLSTVTLSLYYYSIEHYSFSVIIKSVKCESRARSMAGYFSRYHSQVGSSVGEPFDLDCEGFSLELSLWPSSRLH